ncbi:MAG: DUF5615 family PIN-like protein [Synechococcaceae cyanobacterium]
MKLRLDAQLPPLLASWFNTQDLDLEAVPVREIPLRDATDRDIFRQARTAGAVVMTKDRDFIRLLDEQGPPPQVVWLRVGNCSNAALQQALVTTLQPALELLRAGDPWVEVRPRQAGDA